MFLLRILRLLTGYVRFRAYGGFGERFINLCSQNGVILWDIETDGENVIASTSIDGYRNIRTCAKRSGMTVRIMTKHGIPFFIFRNRKRIGIPIGIMIFVFSLSFLSARIWLIDVEGNSKIPEETIIAAAEASGLRTGCSVLKTDPVKISLLAGGRLDGVSEIAVNIHASRAVIKIKEREKSPDIVDSSGMYDLVASKNAQLVILEPYCGTVSARRFNPVMKGEVLISGIVENRDLSTGYVHARGYAVGRSEETIEASVAADEKFGRLLRTGRRLSLYFTGVEIPLCRAGKEYDFMCRKEKFLFFSGRKMPAGLIISEYSSVSDNCVQLPEREKELICIERFMNCAKNYTDNRQIINEHDTESFKSDIKTVSGKFVCYENIGVERRFSINEESSSSE